MLKKILNEARLTYHITATGPILIKDGETEEDKKKRKKENPYSPDMRFIVDANNNVYIPGSSIKGVWRSWCEKMARTISNGVPLACDPFNKTDSINQSCSKRLEIEKEEKNAFIYSKSCPICKLFGNSSLASRIRISDAYPKDGNIIRDSLDIRDGIGIDRFTGGASHGAKFSYQYLIGKTFKTEVQIRNFELWQLGLLGYLFRDFKEELVPIGFGKTRGLGKVKGILEKAELIFYGLTRPKIENKIAQISGIGSLYMDDDRDDYDFNLETNIEKIDFSSDSKSVIKTTIGLNNIQADALFTKAADYWASEKEGKLGGYYLAAQKKRNLIKKE